MTKQKQNDRNFCQFIKEEKLKYHFDISSQTLYYDTQIPPISLDHLSDVSTPWLESTCGKFNQLDIIWKGLYIESSQERSGLHNF